MLELVGLKAEARYRLGTFSKGMQQRIGIGQAIINDPMLVVLDEPTSALDPIGRRDVRDLIRLLKDEGRTVFLNSHLLSEVEMVCDRVAIIDHGQGDRHRANPGAAGEQAGDRRGGRAVHGRPRWRSWRASDR